MTGMDEARLREVAAHRADAERMLAEGRPVSAMTVRGLLDALADREAEKQHLTEQRDSAMRGWDRSRRRLADREAKLALCSQCGERPSVMVKIGTTDGWCTDCLDEAAESPAQARLAAVEALADEWDANLRREFVLSDDDPKWTDWHSRELRAVLHPDPSEAAQGGGER